MEKFIAWLKDLKAATAIEYGMIMLGIALAISAIVFTMGDNLNIIFQSIADKLE